MTIRCDTCPDDAVWIFWINPGLEQVLVRFMCQDHACEHPAVDKQDIRYNWIELVDQ